MAENPHRETTALQGYDPRENLDPTMGSQPNGENRIEMPTAVFEHLLAQHLTDAALDRINLMRAAMRTPA